MQSVPCYRCNRYHRIVSLDNMLSHHKGIVLKSSRPSLLIKRAALGNLKASFHCTHWHRFFPLKKAPPLILVFSPQGRRGKPPSGAQNRYALRLADHQRSSPWLCGMELPGGTLHNIINPALCLRNIG